MDIACKHYSPTHSFGIIDVVIANVVGLPKYHKSAKMALTAFNANPNLNPYAE